MLQFPTCCPQAWAKQTATAGQLRKLAAYEPANGGYSRKWTEDLKLWTEPACGGRIAEALFDVINPR